MSLGNIKKFRKNRLTNINLLLKSEYTVEKHDFKTKNLVIIFQTSSARETIFVFKQSNTLF